MPVMKDKKHIFRGTRRWQYRHLGRTSGGGTRMRGLREDGWHRLGMPTGEGGWAAGGGRRPTCFFFGSVDARKQVNQLRKLDLNNIAA